MKVFIYAYESTYGGMHGINALAVYDVSTLAEADEIGFAMALDITESYDCFDDISDEELLESCCWDVYVIKDEFQSMSIEELDTLCCNLGCDLFTDKYCK